MLDGPQQNNDENTREDECNIRERRHSGKRRKGSGQIASSSYRLLSIHQIMRRIKGEKLFRSKSGGRHGRASGRHTFSPTLFLHVQLSPPLMPYRLLVQETCLSVDVAAYSPPTEIRRYSNLGSSARTSRFQPRGTDSSHIFLYRPYLVNDFLIGASEEHIVYPQRHFLLGIFTIYDFFSWSESVLVRDRLLPGT